MEPPDPIPNSEVKRFSADGSVGFPDARVGHCQAFDAKPLSCKAKGLLFILRIFSFKLSAFEIYIDLSCMSCKKEGYRFTLT